MKSKKLGGKDIYSNLIILHELCHRQIHFLKLTESNLINKLVNLRTSIKKNLSSQEKIKNSLKPLL